MAANTTSGNLQSYQDEGIRIFQGLKPDIVAIQEFQYNNSSASNDLRTLVNTAFGANYDFFVEPTGNIPNGVVSRYPILAAGSWDDTQVNDRGFAWAQIDLPGTNDLYVVSVHLLTANSSVRNTEATNLKALIQANFPSNAWIIVAGDMNTDNRSESAINTFKTFLSDSPIPTDAASGGNEDTNAGRDKPYDYVLTSFSMTNRLTSVVVSNSTFPKGLVFDSRVYSPLSEVAPVQFGDSGAANMQHMAVIKDFLIPTNSAPGNTAPSITSQPQSQTNSIGANINFSVTATGSAPLAYQWRFFGTNVLNSTNDSLNFVSIQTTNAGDYTVVITNAFGSVTSAVATLTIISSPVIATNPQSQTVTVGANATFHLSATGSAPLSYQWRFNNVDIAGAVLTNYTRTNAQLVDAGNYTVVVTNSAGSVTSAVAVLTVNPLPTGSVIAQWNFNSVPPDANNATGTTTPNVGSGTASLVSGTTATFATGHTTGDPAGSTDNSGWNSAGYPSQGAGNKTAGTQFAVSTAGRQNISVTWSSQGSNTGSRYGRLQYSTNGVNFVDVASAFTNTTTFTSKTNYLSAFPGVNDNSNFAIRFVAEFESTATGSANANYVAANSPTSNYGTSGTMRYDMVTILGDTITVSNPQAISPTLTNASVSGGQLQFQLTGTTGSNYIIQATTNLSPANWIPLRTNAAPFIFVESNIFLLPQRFYRGMIAP